MGPLECWDGPYESMLAFLDSRDFFGESLRESMLRGRAVDGILRVNVPFCGAFMECRRLCHYLQGILARPSLRLSGVAVSGMDVKGEDWMCWEQKERYFRRKDPKITLQLLQ